MWSSLWWAVGWAWTYAVPVALVGFVALILVAGLCQPVRRAPWVGVTPRWHVFVGVGVLLVLSSDAVFGTGLPVYERVWKGTVAVLLALLPSIQTLRWLAAGRPDEPVPPAEGDQDDQDDGDGSSRGRPAA